MTGKMNTREIETAGNGRGRFIIRCFDRNLLEKLTYDNIGAGRQIPDAKPITASL